VRRAAQDLQQDVLRVTAVQPDLLTDNVPRASDVVVVGTLGRSRLIEKLVSARKLAAGQIRNRWESSVIQVVSRPWPGVERALVIAGATSGNHLRRLRRVGADRRLALVLVGRRARTPPRSALRARGPARARGAGGALPRPLHQRRGARAQRLAREKFGGFNHRFYSKVFELVLRLRGNFLWPAMWGNAFNDDDPLNPGLADEYGVVVGTRTTSR